MAPKVKVGDPLSPRQKKVMRAIVRYHREHGYPPTYRELSGLIGMGLGELHTQMKLLIAKGCVQRLKGVARGLKVLRHPDGVL